MAGYNGYFPAGYQPAQIYYPPMQQNNFTPTQNNQQQNNSMIWVNGEVGAKSYLVAPNTTVVLWDSEEPVIYIKSADVSGMPSIKTLDYTMRENGSRSEQIEVKKEFATKDDVESIREEITALKAKFDDTKETTKKKEK